VASGATVSENSDRADKTDTLATDQKKQNVKKQTCHQELVQQQDHCEMILPVTVNGRYNVKSSRRRFTRRVNTDRVKSKAVIVV
jgi:hypothetical protein